MNRLAILGGGSWGTALAVVLAPRFSKIRLWVRRAELASEMQHSRKNQTYLPDIELPVNVEVTADLARAVLKAEIVLSVLPSHAVREIFTQTQKLCPPGLPIVSATKGLESASLLRISQIIEEVTGSRRVAVLSGPSFAQEVAAGCPTAVVVAILDADLAGSIQAAFSGPTFRVYTSSDPVGVEIGGAYKNVVAIAAGVCTGLNLGHNTIAALITRGLAEMTRLALSMGAQAQTLSGLSGLGDLVLTCTGGLSRNHNVGMQLADGQGIHEILKSMKMVAEGVLTTASIVNLGTKYGVDLPIAAQMNAVLNLGRSPAGAIRLLMDRALRSE